MKLISIVGAFFLTLALIFFGLGSISMQRFWKVSKGVLWFLLIGLILDATAIICMIIGSRNTIFSIHAILGYSAILVMFVNLVLAWRVYNNGELKDRIDKTLHLYTKLAFVWWVIAYIIGSLMVILK